MYAKKNHPLKSPQPHKKFIFPELLVKNRELCRFQENNCVFMQKKSPILKIAPAIKVIFC